MSLENQVSAWRPFRSLGSCFFGAGIATVCDRPCLAVSLMVISSHSGPTRCPNQPGLMLSESRARLLGAGTRAPSREPRVTLGVTRLSHGPRSLTWFKLAGDKKASWESGPWRNDGANGSQPTVTMLHDQEIQTDESDSERQIVKQLNERIKFSFVTGLLILGQLSHHHNDPMTLQRHNVITLSPSDPGNAL